MAAFATGLPPDIHAFHCYSGIPPSPLTRQTVSKAALWLSQDFTSDLSHRLRALLLSNSEQRLPPLSYRGCWHRVSRGLSAGYHHYFPCKRSLQPEGFILHAAPLHRLSPICAKFHCCLLWSRTVLQCGRSTLSPATCLGLVAVTHQLPDRP